MSPAMLAKQLQQHLVTPTCSTVVPACRSRLTHRASKRGQPRLPPQQQQQAHASARSQGLSTTRTDRVLQALPKDRDESTADLVDQRVAQFHKEFEAAVQQSSLGLTPEEAAAIQGKVQEANVAARSMPARREAPFSADADTALGEGRLAARLGDKVADEQYRAGFMQLAPGTVLLKDTSLPYDASRSRLRSFSATPCEGVQLLPGSTHVAVAFTDLGELAAAVSRWGTTESDQLAAFPLECDEGRPDAAAVQAEMTELILQQDRMLMGLEPPAPAYDQRSTEANRAHAVLQVMRCVHQVHAGNVSGSSGSNGNGNGSGRGAGHSQQAVAVVGTAGQPLRWVGYEASPYAVAKAEVLLEMLRQGADTDAVLQVWYSSGWSHSTKPAFQSALEAVLTRSGSSQASTAQQQEVSASVLQLLQHWQQHPDTPLGQSRSSWLARVQDSKAFIGGFARQQDRLALMRYCFTGELLTVDVGSTVMASLPGNSQPWAADESFLQCFRPSTLLRAWQLQQFPDIVSAGVSVLRRRISRLGELVRQGEVVAEVHHGAITIANTTTLLDIKRMQPLSMSWGSVAEYMQAEEYHSMAQLCSAHATVHFMRCKDWVKEVKGASWVDWIMDKLGAQEQGLQQDADAIDEFVRELLQKSSAVACHSYSTQGIDKLLLSDPPVDEPGNVIDGMLHYRLYEEWLGAFMVWAEEVASETTSTSIIRIAAAVQRSLPLAPRQDPFEGLVPEDDGLTVVLPLSPPCYASPLQYSSPTFEVAFVQYGDVRSDVS